MRITDQRFLAEDNRYTSQPCLLSILELDDDASATPAAQAALSSRLQTALPGLRRQRGLIGKRYGAAPQGAQGRDVEPQEVPHLVHLVQQVAMELRRLACDEVTIGFVGVVPRMKGRYRLVLPYAAESAKSAAAAALGLATQLVDAMRAGRAFNIKAAVARLRALAERRAVLRDHAEKQLNERSTWQSNAQSNEQSATRSPKRLSIPARGKLLRTARGILMAMLPGPYFSMRAMFGPVAPPVSGAA